MKGGDEKKRRFSSQWGFVLSAVGSAVGMANVWGFPAKMGSNGGGAFLLAYLFFIALFGRAIASHPAILVLDEPLSYIDKHFEEHLYSIISEMAPYTTILLVSHEMSQISAMANRHIIVDHSLHECTATHHYLKPECE